MSGLKINFSKSSFGVVGMLERWKEDAAMFLNCSLLVIPFLYLGTLIGTNQGVLRFGIPSSRNVRESCRNGNKNYFHLGEG